MSAVMEENETEVLFGHPQMIQTVDTEIAALARKISDWPIIAGNKLAQAIVPGHPPCEVRALMPTALQKDQVEKYLSAGYEYADPITFMCFIMRVGWPRGICIHSKMGDGHIVGEFFGGATRIDYKPKTGENEIIVLQKPVKLSSE